MDRLLHRCNDDDDNDDGDADTVVATGEASFVTNSRWVGGGCNNQSSFKVVGVGDTKDRVFYLRDGSACGL